MKCSLDKVLLDARQLANKIRANDEVADVLIKQASDAHSKVLAKKQTQEGHMEYDQLVEITKNRPRSHLMMKMVAENKKLELLQQENKVLRTSLSEYETTFQMILKKYKKHKEVLEKLEKIEKGDLLTSSLSSKSDVNQIVIHCSKITKLKKEIEKMANVDSKAYDQLSEIQTKLIIENRELNRLIKISEEVKNDLCKSIENTSSKSKKHKSELFNIMPINHENHNSINGITTKAKTIKLNSNNFVNPKKGDNSIDEIDDDDHSSIASDASIQTITG